MGVPSATGRRRQPAPWWPGRARQPERAGTRCVDGLRAGYLPVPKSPSWSACGRNAAWRIQSMLGKADAANEGHL